jgi:hypothetical protein
VVVVVGEQFAGGGDDDEEEVRKRNHARNFCLSEKGLVLRLWREVDCRERERERRERAHMGSVSTALQQEDEEMIVTSMDELLQHCMTGEE